MHLENAIFLRKMVFESFVLNCPFVHDYIKEKLNAIVVKCLELDKSANGFAIFVGDPLKCITPRGCESSASKSGSIKTVNPVSISTPIIKTIRTLISIMWSETFMAISYLIYRLRMVHYLRETTKLLLDEFENSTDKASSTNIVKAYEGWFTRYTAYSIDVDQPELIRKLRPYNSADAIKKNATRIKNILQAILKELDEAVAKDSSIPKLVLMEIDDLIIRRTMDFNYPFGASFIEYFRGRQLVGRGFPQLTNVRRSHFDQPRAALDELEVIRNELTISATRVYKDELLPKLREVDILKWIKIDSGLFTQVGEFTANFLFDLGVSIFNYVKANTDRAHSTTIQYSALQTILLQHTISLTADQYKLIWFLINYYIYSAKKVSPDNQTPLQKFFSNDLA